MADRHAQINISYSELFKTPNSVIYTRPVLQIVRDLLLENIIYTSQLW